MDRVSGDDDALSAHKSVESLSEAVQRRQQMVSSHAPSLVGWWCSLVDFFFYWVLVFLVHLERWAGELG
jgi:hypothetical protein